jgi:hypothetical protein
MGKSHINAERDFRMWAILAGRRWRGNDENAQSTV